MLGMAEQRYPSELAGRYIVRFPEGMREQIAAAAKGNNRSINAEIIARLQAAERLLVESQESKQRLAVLRQQVEDAKARATKAESDTRYWSKTVPELRAEIEDLSRRLVDAKVVQNRLTEERDKLSALIEKERARSDDLIRQVRTVSEQKTTPAPHGGALDLRHALQLQIGSVQMQSEVLAMRAEVIRLRAENLHARHQVIASEVDAIVKAAKTDDDFARAEAKVSELRRLERALPEVGRELQVVIAERDALVKRLDDMRELLTSKTRDLESRMEEYLLRQTPEKRQELLAKRAEVPSFFDTTEVVENDPYQAPPGAIAAQDDSERPQVKRTSAKTSAKKGGR